MQVFLSSTKLDEQAVIIPEVQTCLVRDNQGNPIFLAIQQSDGHIWAVTAADAQFQELIKTLGIEKREATTVGG